MKQCNSVNLDGSNFNVGNVQQIANNYDNNEDEEVYNQFTAKDSNVNTDSFR